VPAFALDRHEVTWARYRRCVEAGACSVRGLNRLPSTRAALRDPQAAALPVSGVTYDEALRFCVWEGKRLPTELEWERAARGADGRDYPWGNDLPGAETLSLRTSYPIDALGIGQYPPAVGSSTQDTSAEGVQDLFGSVDEWVSDFYSPEPSGSAAVAPIFLTKQRGEDSLHAAGEMVVRGHRWSLRGGAGWDVATRGAPVWFRNPRAADAGAGFRCAGTPVRSREMSAPAFPIYRHIESNVVRRAFK
jgi:formylglycine-generating enzyme required for sulfatase activity